MEAEDMTSVASINREFPPELLWICQSNTIARELKHADSMLGNNPNNNS